MKVGYARVSTRQQSLQTQLDTLEQAGCHLIAQEKQSGATADRTKLKKILNDIKPGDTLIVTSLDRLARSTADLLNIVKTLDERGAHFKSLREPWADTTSTMGKFMLTVFGGVAEFERNLTMERCQIGREAARKRGVKFGRKPKLTPHQRKLAKNMLGEGQSIRMVANHFNVGPTTIHRIKAKTPNINEIVQ